MIADNSQTPAIPDVDAILDWAATDMWEPGGPVQAGPGPHPAWLRAWPSGHVHYSQDWTARRDGRIDTACHRNRIFWPHDHWPKATICRQCAAIFRQIVRAKTTEGGAS